LQALPKVDELVRAAKEHGMEALALTDSGNLHGAIEFYKEAKEAKLKPIIGIDAYIAPKSRFDRENNQKRYRLVLLAENNEGYKNLLYLVTKSFTEGFYERPLMDKEILRERGQGLIALIPSFTGDVPELLGAGQSEAAGAALAEWASIFPGKSLPRDNTPPARRGSYGAHEEGRRIIEAKRHPACRPARYLLSETRGPRSARGNAPHPGRAPADRV
jgi:DNA polymerase III alpha subunit